MGQFLFRKLHNRSWINEKNLKNYCLKECESCLLSAGNHFEINKISVKECAEEKNFGCIEAQLMHIWYNLINYLHFFAQNKTRATIFCAQKSMSKLETKKTNSIKIIIFIFHSGWANYKSFSIRPLIPTLCLQWNQTAKKGKYYFGIQFGIWLAYYFCSGSSVRNKGLVSTSALSQLNNW